MVAAASDAGARVPGGKGDMHSDNAKKKSVRAANIDSAKAVADAVRTSLGPRGMDKMVCAPNNEVLITNDGATILQKMTVTQPAAKMLVELSKSQDVVAGDGTTSVVVICGALLRKCSELLEKGVHPTVISDAFQGAAGKAIEILEKISMPVDLSDRDALVQAATTSLSSKVVSQYSSLLAPMAMDSVMRIRDASGGNTLDLKDVRIVSKLGGTVDDSELIDGMVFDQRAAKGANGPTKVQNAKIALIQFCVSPPKTDLENNVVVSDYAAMDRILKEERNYILGMVKKIKASGCNVLLIQKSILRDATTELSLHYLAKAKIMVIKDIERDDIDFISKTLNCLPVAHIDHLKPEKLGQADLVQEVECGKGRVVKVTGIQNMGRTCTLLLRGSNKLVLEEAERSLHDAQCVIRCLVNKPKMIVGGSAPEVELMQQLSAWSKTLQGMESYCVRAFAEALEVIPYTLAENAGLNPIEIVTELRNRHAMGSKHDGINVRKGAITNMLEENVIQPLLVTSSAINLACECVRMILKIDDIVPVR
uniref:T-complex protein 1 subunit delta n=3 Tax=Tetraselmis sp. GSL018 TaxID=582737 RepID=A0A061SGC2_9CHLO|mmetsp:Transcript_24693/g.58773  ORF Transcript_24693/g.58773 Transcript_24693/m.58773 type:complete len:537 (-) Transcript_24693:160-1770(-)|eukprot:CAMPEP_0177589412 /NCGR_PEP_ID=MMETSP0419_2-20121207/6789_1 /TAXON_ID=582737 /ORGANISM="Tetraselmis sp., Strain GSL018" /LENGTH=536 /DNA_ID=CAMNT_0019079763 /DNA_START=446 /DNA_END=2056 /DNA_ORIENTATION=-